MDRLAALGLCSAAPSAHLATVTPAGRPHIVPIVFALDGDTLVTAVDHKPKSTMRLQRLANIEANQAVSVMVDHYEDDWEALWWVRIDGRATLIDSNGPRHAEVTAPLRKKYSQYADAALGTAITIDIERVSGWAADR